MNATSLLGRSLNHLLQQNPGALEALSQHAGQTVRFDLVVQQLDFCITETGAFIETATDLPDATLRATPKLLSRLPFFGRDALRNAEYSGDAALLHTLDKVMNGLKWDVEADLAPVMGGVAAHRVRLTAHAVLDNVRLGLRSLQTNAAEYIVEEIELVARKIDVRRHSQQVDTLVNDVARLEARLARLEASAPVREAPSRTE